MKVDSPGAARLRMIEGAIEAIRSQGDLSPEARKRGISALERARARLVSAAAIAAADAVPVSKAADRGIERQPFPG